MTAQPDHPGFPAGDALRIIDANLNRAREGLRVMEDAARFLLNDAELSRELKSARHALRGLAEAAGLNPTLLAAWRDTPGDVGTGTTAPAETERPTAAAIAIAAGKRVGEALRTIEEWAKVGASDSQPSAAAKSLRYRVYDLERRLTLAMGTGHARQWRLCVLITEALCTHHGWDRVAELALKGGADCIQLREKTLEGGELLARARRLRTMTREHSAALVINDRPDIALLIEADGVHVGQSDLRVSDIRRISGTRLLVGVSTANMQQAHAAASDGADSCGCGPMFATTTKHKPVLSGPEYLRAYLNDPRTSRLPHLAISGITSANVGELARVGCKGVAVSSAVCSSPDPEAACREILAALGNR